MTTEGHDYVIVGGGSAGAVLAARLSEDPTCRVLLLEAGPGHRSWQIDMPAAVGRLVAGRRFNWGFVSETEPYLDGRRLSHPRGRVLGGSSSINGMVWLRGHPRDYDGWAQRGARGWSFEEVLPAFRRAETAPEGADALRGRGGPVRVHRPDLRTSPLAAAFVRAGVEAGHPETPDFNGTAQEGFGAFERSTHRGRRWSVARAYLDPARGRANLAIRTGARALRVEIAGARATGLRYLHRGQERLARAGTAVILAAGAFGSPHLLQLSGVGDPTRLAAAGITPLHDLPGVGENLNDHPDIAIQHRCRLPVSLWPVTRAPRRWLAGAEWALRGTGPAASNHFEAGAFLRSHPGVEDPDLQFTFMPLAVVPGTVEIRAEHAFQVHINIMRPLSRGRVWARSADPLAPPAILFNYLAEPRDRADLRAAVRLLRTVLAQPAMARFSGGEIAPGPEVADDAALDAWMRRAVETCYHPVGTCRMGASDDPGAVVDPECRLRGIDGLRVVDASVMPEIVSANTNCPTIMIAERAAELIRGRVPRSATPERIPA